MLENNETTPVSQKITIIGTKPNGTRNDAHSIVERVLDVTQVRNNFEQFLQSLNGIIDVGIPHVGAFELDEVSFSAEITASGEFKLLGVGTGIDVKGGVTFTLRQKKQVSPS